MPDEIKCIKHLQEAIKKTHGIHSPLCIYRRPENTQWNDEDESHERFLEITLEGDGQLIENAAVKLRDRQTIERLNPKISEEETLLVKVLGMFSHFSFYPPRLIFSGRLPVPVWYCLINQENKVNGDVSKVSAALVADFKDRVKDESPNDLRYVDAEKLVVWHYNLPHFHTSTEPLFIKNINFNDDVNAIKLTNHTDICDLGLVGKEMLIVQMPGAFSLCSRWCLQTDYHCDSSRSLLNEPSNLITALKKSCARTAGQNCRRSGDKLQEECAVRSGGFSESSGCSSDGESNGGGEE